MNGEPKLDDVKAGDKVFVRSYGHRGSRHYQAVVTSAHRVWITVRMGEGGPGYEQRFRRDTGTCHAPGKGYTRSDRLMTPDMIEWERRRMEALAEIKRIVGDVNTFGNVHSQNPEALASVLLEAEAAGRIVPNKVRER